MRFCVILVALSSAAVAACGGIDTTVDGGQGGGGEGGRGSDCVLQTCSDAGVCQPVTVLEGDYCTGVSKDWRDGACFEGSCKRCGAFECGGVLGCSSDDVFASNGQIGCPEGCWSSCAP